MTGGKQGLSAEEQRELKRMIEIMADADDHAAKRAEEDIHALVRSVPITDLDHVPDTLLDPDALPVGTRAQAELSKLGMTYHGYTAFGGQGPLTAFGNVARRRFKRSGAVPVTTTGLRAALFMETRRRVHQGGEMTEDDWRYADALVAALSAALRGVPDARKAP